jgi:hypothetical protein
MNVGLHQRAERGIDHPMAFDGSLTRKATRKDAHLEMASAVARSGVASMAAAIVDNVELLGVELRLKLASYQRDALGGHGAT